MNNNPNQDRRPRPEHARTPDAAPRGGEISVLSAILTGRRSRSVACVIVALVIALTAVMTVAASIVSSHLADDGEGEDRAVLANTEKTSNAAESEDGGKESGAEADKTTEAAKSTEAGSEASDAVKDAKAGKSADESKEDVKTDDGETKDGDSAATSEADDKTDDDAETDDKTDDETKDDAPKKAPGVHTVTVTFYDKEDLVSDTTAATLGDFLLYSGVTLTDAQLANLDLSTKLDSDMTFAADIVSYDTVTEDETLPFETQYRDTTDIAEGTESVAQEGVNGVLTTAFDVKYVNGVEVYREQKGSWVSTEAVDQIILRGVVPAATDTGYADTDASMSAAPAAQSGTSAGANGLPAATVYEDGYLTGEDGITRHYYAYLDVQATCYAAGGTTASGLPADEHVMGVGRYEGTMTPIIPFGTLCYVKGAVADCGERIAADYGNMFGNKIDLCIDMSDPKYYGFGWQAVRVYFIG